MQDVADVSRIAFGSVADKDFRCVHLDAVRCEVVADDRLNQEVISPFRSVSVKGRAVGHFVYSPMHGLNAGFGQRPGHIADSQADELCFGMLFLEGSYFACNLREQIASRQFQKMVIDA